jgi:NAD(P)-dependent dehydrogenase (short-subunit alcohol dehydrogenase family)
LASAVSVRRKILVTGSTTGLGHAAAAALVAGGHQVLVHARSAGRAGEIGSLTTGTAGVVVGDLADLAQFRALAEDANRFGPFDAVIHNAGIYVDDDRNATPQGHARVLAVNVLAPYLLTALIDRPGRLVYLSSGMHRSGDPTLADIGWAARRWNGVQAYCDSKLYVTALSAALARRWPDVLANAVDPGWVPTRMGGPHATDDLTLGHGTQVWLATSVDPAAIVTGRYWHHQRPENPAPAADDPAFQDALLDELARLTDIELASH